MSFDFPRLPLHIVPHEVTATSAGLWIGWFSDTNPPAKLQLSCVSAAGGEPLTVMLGSSWQLPLKRGSYQPRYQWLPIYNLGSGSLYHVTVKGKNNNLLGMALFETLPTRLPSLDCRPFTVFLGSCFHYRYDGGRAGDGYQVLYNNEIYRPYIKFLVGDQVYIDQPWYGIQHRMSTAELRSHCISIYEKSWEGMRKILGQGGTYFTSDDHEFYNDYPNPPLYLPALKIGSYRTTWTKITKALYESLQTNTRTSQISIRNELSFFVLDTRIERTSGNRFVSVNSLNKLSKWVSSLICPGVLIMGQPLFHTKRNRSYDERNLPDYSQYQSLVKILSKSHNDIVVLSGDVHFGRVARAKLNTSRIKIVEVISSPMSLVDDGTGIGGKIAKSRWRLGIDNDPSHFPTDSVPGVQKTPIQYLKAVSRKKGDDDRTAENFATVSFWRGKSPGTVLMRVQYWLPRRNRARDVLYLDFCHDEILYSRNCGHGWLLTG